MKLRSVDPRVVERGSATVVVNDLSRPYDFSHCDSGSTFSEDPLSLEIVKSYPIVGVNLDTQRLGALWDAASAAGCDRVSYWVDAEGALNLRAVIQSLDTLAIDGVTPLGEGVLIDITEASASDRDCTDFLSGVLTGQKLYQVTAISEAPVPSREQLSNHRATLLTELVHLAKPLKPYLPASAIHAGYKVLGALR